MSITQLAETAASEILSARENGPRAASYQLSFLNRNPRVLRGIRKRYTAAAKQLHQSDTAITQQWADIKDLAELEASCDG